MPLDPQVWNIPPLYRRFPDQVAEHYESEETPLFEVCELWAWRWDLVGDAGPLPFVPPQPDERKMADRLGKEASDFLRIEEEFSSS